MVDFILTQRCLFEVGAVEAVGRRRSLIRIVGEQVVE